jgi:hypothetical protein
MVNTSSDSNAFVGLGKDNILTSKIFSYHIHLFILLNIVLLQTSANLRSMLSVNSLPCLMHVSKI